MDSHQLLSQLTEHSVEYITNYTGRKVLIPSHFNQYLNDHSYPTMFFERRGPSGSMIGRRERKNWPLGFLTWPQAEDLIIELDYTYLRRPSLDLLKNLPWVPNSIIVIYKKLDRL